MDYKVSIVIPTFNRFKYLLNAIESIKNQTHKNIEIIVVNDRSTQKEYYTYNWEKNNIIIIHLEKNTKKMFGFACAGYVRTAGIKKSTGDYIAFCDDDDIWFPKKLEIQLKSMKKNNCKMSSSDGLIGKGVFDPNKKYLKVITERHFETVQNIYKSKGSDLLDNGYPKIWNRNFLKIHNSMITSSVIIKKDILDKINNFKNMKPPGEDYDCWLRALKYTNSIFVRDICVYYDDSHGDGRNWSKR